MNPEMKPWTVADSAGDIVVSEPDLPQLAVRVVDRLIQKMLTDEKPNTARYQRIQTLCSIGANLNQLYAVAIEDAQPVDEELGVGGLGYGLGIDRMPMPQGMPRPRRVGQYVGGDTAELIRMLLAAIERLHPAQRDVAAAVAATIATDAVREADADVALDRARAAVDGATDTLAVAQAAVRDAEAAVALTENPIG